DVDFQPVSFAPLSCPNYRNLLWVGDDPETFDKPTSFRVSYHSNKFSRLMLDEFDFETWISDLTRDSVGRVGRKYRLNNVAKSINLDAPSILGLGVAASSNAKRVRKLLGGAKAIFNDPVYFDTLRNSMIRHFFNEEKLCYKSEAMLSHPYGHGATTGLSMRTVAPSITLQNSFELEGECTPSQQGKQCSQQGYSQSLRQGKHQQQQPQPKPQPHQQKQQRQQKEEGQQPQKQLQRQRQQRPHLRSSRQSQTAGPQRRKTKPTESPNKLKNRFQVGLDQTAETLTSLVSCDDMAASHGSGGLPADQIKAPDPRQPHSRSGSAEIVSTGQQKRKCGPMRGSRVVRIEDPDSELTRSGEIGRFALRLDANSFTEPVRYQPTGSGLSSSQGETAVDALDVDLPRMEVLFNIAEQVLHFPYISEKNLLESGYHTNRAAPARAPELCLGLFKGRVATGVAEDGIFGERLQASIYCPPAKRPAEAFGCCLPLIFLPLLHHLLFALLPWLIGTGSRAFQGPVDTMCCNLSPDNGTF
ncbi:unnamed protein product, partial [Protopolystoma xenopodis]